MPATKQWTARDFASRYPSKRAGECDYCHAYPVPLYDDPASEGAEEWRYCAACWAAIVNKHGIEVFDPDA